MKRLHNAGQHQSRPRTPLAKFPDENVPEDTLASYRELKAEYDGVDDEAKRPIRYVEDLAPRWM